MAKKVILDTSFILSAIREKIDFFEDIPLMGLSIVIAKQVVRELTNVASSDQKLKFRQEAELALKILEDADYEVVDLKGKQSVDKSLIRYCKENTDALIATLDKEIKRAVPNQKLVIRARKKLEII